MSESAQRGTAAPATLAEHAAVALETALATEPATAYYVGYCEVRDRVGAVRAAPPGWSQRALHDAVLAHGSPPVRHLRSLLLGEPGSAASRG